jgi:hypothetical protein
MPKPSLAQASAAAAAAVMLLSSPAMALDLPLDAAAENRTGGGLTGSNPISSALQAIKDNSQRARDVSDANARLYPTPAQNSKGDATFVSGQGNPGRFSGPGSAQEVGQGSSSSSIGSNQNEVQATVSQAASALTETAKDIPGAVTNAAGKAATIAGEILTNDGQVGRNIQQTSDEVFKPHPPANEAFKNKL